MLTFLPQIFAQMGRKLPRPLTHTTFLLALELARKQGLLEAPRRSKIRASPCISMTLASIFSFDVKQASSSRSKTKTADLHLYANAMSYVRLASGAEDADSLFSVVNWDGRRH